MAAVRKGTERKIIKTIVTSDPEATRKLTIYEPYCDFFLLDSRVAGYTGGTGGENDWRACAELIKRTSKPVFIAGGLRPDNVEAAMVLTKPYGTDVSTGVSCYSDSYLRKDRKDLSKIAEFIRISKAFDEQ